jgi:chorismate synthase
MAGNTFGEIFRVTTFGESHGPAMGCIIDGCPAGLELSNEDIEKELLRRQPESRKEDEKAEILSGVFEGKTLGTPIMIVIRNSGQITSDYDSLKNIYRTAHADYTWEVKFGHRDHRGGGRSSGRETISRVAAGAVAKKILSLSGIIIRAWASSIAGFQMPIPGGEGFNFDEIERNHLRVPCKLPPETNLPAAKTDSALNEGNFADNCIISKIEEICNEGDSAGGIVSCLIKGIPAGLGEPVFNKLDARIAAAIISIGACKGIEFGAGFASASMKGSENQYSPAEDSEIFPGKNSGGILGGISTGEEIFFNAAFKPTPTTGIPQKVLDKEGNTREITIKGRHDICIVPRVVPVVEAMAALVLLDFILLAQVNKL